MNIADPTLEQALGLAHRLRPQDRAALIAQLAAELAAVAEAPVSPPTTLTLPVLRGGTWPDDLPLRRSELYKDDERC